MSLNKDKEGLHPINLTISPIIGIIQEVRRNKITLIELDALAFGHSLGLFTLSELSKFTISNYRHIDETIKRLLSHGLIELKGKRRTSKRTAKVYSLTDAGCALVARLSALCR